MDSRTYPVSRRNVDLGDGNHCIEGRDIVVHDDQWNENADHTAQRTMRCTLHRWQTEPRKQDDRLDIVVNYQMDATAGFVIREPYTILTERPAIMFQTRAEMMRWKNELTRICKWNMDSSIHDLRIRYAEGGDHD